MSGLVETCLPIFYSSVGVVFCNLEAADVQFLAGAPDAGVAFLRKFQVGLRIPRSSRAPFRFDGARASELIARSVPRIVRAVFRADRAQFEMWRT